MGDIKIVIGTTNRKKQAEIEAVLEGLDVELLTLDDLPEAPEVVEDGETFSDNAAKKALALANFYNMWVMADDSGLEVVALDNRPGVFSNRYAGDGATDEDKARKLLGELKDVPDDKRAARFRCAIALAKPGEVVFVVEGRYEGVIIREPRGNHGFGYDPVFLAPDRGQTFAEISPLEKNRISHRAQALKLFRDKLANLKKGQWRETNHVAIFTV